MTKSENKDQSQKKLASEKGIHDGHRMRLIETAFRAGVEDLSEIQAVELLLFYIFPRGDVNPLAHRLLSKFGNLTHIVDADVQELKLVRGISDSSAKKLKVFGRLMFYYTHSKMRNKKVVKYADIVDIMEELLRFHTTENMVFVALGANSTVIRTKIIDSQNSASVGVNMLEFSAFLSSAHPASIVVGHCHPYGSATPSTEDKNTFSRMKRMTEAFGVEFVDSYIVGEDGVFSQSKNNFVRKYFQISQEQFHKQTANLQPQDEQ